MDMVVQILFSQVLQQSEAKLNLGSAAALKAGSDKDYDMLLQSLGSMAKHSPKIIVDSLMIWRKSHPSAGQNGSLLNVVLIRVLVEIVKATNMQLHVDLSMKLEEMIFNQILAGSQEFDLFSELLGQLSVTRFDSIKRRYVSLLDTHAGNEHNLELLFRSMRFLRLKLYPEEHLEETVDFIRYMAELYRDSFNSGLKTCYSDLMINLLTPLAPIVSAECNIPEWGKAMEILLGTCQKAIGKGKSYGFLLATAILCVSRRDYFLQKMPGMIETAVPRLKDKVLKSTSFLCIIRLVWVHLHRCTEAITTTYQRLDGIVKLVYPNKKINPADFPLDYFCLLNRMVLHKHWEYGSKLLWTLANGDATFTQMEHLQPERISISIRSLTEFIVIDQNVLKVGFPCDWECLPSGDAYPDANLFTNAAPVKLSNSATAIPERVKPLALKFNALLGKVMKLLDDNFGNNLLSDERHWAIGTAGSGSSNLNLDSGVLSKEKIPYFELMRICISSIPLLYPDMEHTTLINMLCKYLIHVDSGVSAAAKECLIRIAHIHLENLSIIVSSFCAFLLGLEESHSDILLVCMRDFVQLANLWLDFVVSNHSKQSRNNDGPQMDVWNIIQELECVGLMFLCSPLPTVRVAAIQILQVSKDVHEKALKQAHTTATGNDLEHMYILRIIEGCGASLVENYKHDYTSNMDDYLTVCSMPSFISDIARSENLTIQHLWMKFFPDIIRLCYEKCPTVADICLTRICSKLIQQQSAIAVAADPSKTQSATLTGKWSLRQITPATDDAIERWKYHIVFACVCMTVSEPQKKSRKSIKELQSAQELFQIGLPLLSCEKASIRLAVVVAFGNVNWVVYKDLIEALEPFIKSVIEDMRSRYIRGSTKRVKRLERLRAEITHILYLSATILRQSDYFSDGQLIGFLTEFIRETGSFLAHTDVQNEWDHQMLRYYFCGFVETFYQISVESTEDVVELPFEIRYSLFNLFEGWCGYGQRGLQMRERESNMISALLEQVKDLNERNKLTGVIDEQRKALEFAAIKAMSTLCKGQLIGREIESGPVFDPSIIFEWIDAIFSSENEKLIFFGRNAVEAIILHNDEHEATISRELIDFCYNRPSHFESAKAYFLAYCNVAESISCTDDKSLTIVLLIYKLADEDVLVRKTALELLCKLERRYFGDTTSKVHEIAIVSPLSATYSLGQYNVSSLLAGDRPELGFFIISEIFSRMESVDANGQKTLFHIMLPWLQGIDLTTEERFGEMVQLSSLLLWNLFYCNVKYGKDNEKELQEAWSMLVSNMKNTTAIVAFLIQLGLEKRGHLFALHAKRIMLYIGRTPAKQKLIEILLGELTPKSMIPVKRSRKGMFENLRRINSFVFSLDDILQAEARSSVLSKGQLILMFLVDFAIEHGSHLTDHLPVLLHSILVQFDHYNDLAREHVKSLLISLIHSIGNIDDASRSRSLALVNYLNTSEDIIFAGKGTSELPEKLSELAAKLIDIFEISKPNLRQTWGEVSIKWSTSCPVRHIACRSLQYFQVISPKFTHKMLADCLARLSNTIADPNDDVRGFATEILKTLDQVSHKFDPELLLNYPQLFWSAVACLNTHHISEYSHALRIVGVFMRALETSDKDRLDKFIQETKPNTWVSFGGLCPLIYQGLRIDDKSQFALNLLNMCSGLDNVVKGSGWCVYAAIGNAVALLEEFRRDEKLTNFDAKPTESISFIFELFGEENLSKIFGNFAKKRFRTPDDFLRQVVNVVKDALFPKHDYIVLSALFSLLTNRNPSKRAEVLKILHTLFQIVQIPPDTAKLIMLHEIEPLLRLLKTDQSKEALLVFDDLCKIQPQHLNNLTIKLLLNARRQEDDQLFSSLITVSDIWSFRKASLEITRTMLTAVLAFYISLKKNMMEPVLISEAVKRNPKGIKASHEDFDVVFSESNADFLMIEDFANLDELLHTIEDLDDFFTEEGIVIKTEPSSPIGKTQNDIGSTDIFSSDAANQVLDIGEKQQLMNVENDLSSDDEEDAFLLERQYSAVLTSDVASARPVTAPAFLKTPSKQRNSTISTEVILRPSTSAVDSHKDDVNE